MTPISWMHAFVDVPGEDVAKAHAFWSAVLGWPLGDPWPVVDRNIRRRAHLVPNAIERRAIEQPAGGDDRRDSRHLRHVL